jgi:hypothetical protein
MKFTMHLQKRFPSSVFKRPCINCNNCVVSKVYMNHVSRNHLDKMVLKCSKFYVCISLGGAQNNYRRNSSHDNHKFEPGTPRTEDRYVIADDVHSAIIWRADLVRLTCRGAKCDVPIDSVVCITGFGMRRIFSGSPHFSCHKFTHLLYVTLSICSLIVHVNQACMLPGVRTVT